MTKTNSVNADAPPKSEAKAAGSNAVAQKRSKPRKSGGDRPTTYTEALGLEICSRLVNGETLDRICGDAHMPDSRVTVFRWRRANPQFNTDYLAARSDQLDALGDEVLDIAETEKDIARARLKLEARRICISRLSTRYGAAIEANTPEQPFDLAGAIEAARKKMDELIKEVGWERAERLRQDEVIENARNPDPRQGEVLIRANQRVAMHYLEGRRKALLDLAHTKTVGEA